MKNTIFRFIVLGIMILTSCSKDEVKPNYPQIGETYQGGIIFYVFKSGDFFYKKGEFHGLIVLDDENSSIWGCNNVQINDIPGNLGGGFNATNNIVSKCTGSSAAKLCANLYMNGYNDWYLPNKAEFNEILKTKSQLTFNSTYYWVCQIGYAINPSNGVYQQFPITDIKAVKPIRKF